MGCRSRGAHTAMSCIVLSPTVGANQRVCPKKCLARVYKGAHKTSSVLRNRKPAPPNEEQFNAPTAGGCTRLNASLLAVDNMSCYKVVGADYRLFSQFGYIFYVLSMPIESTKELCAYGRFLNGKRS